MIKLFIKCVGAVFVLCVISCMPMQAKPYVSKNQVCIVEKSGGDYTFLNEAELRSRQADIFGSSKAKRDQFEWFFTEKQEGEDTIVAKVYPALRDALIESPNEQLIQKVSPCLLTRKNQKLATFVDFEYKSKDKICACIKEGGKLNCSVTVNELLKAPFSSLVPFFEVGDFSAVIVGRVPLKLFETIWNLPNDFSQQVSNCGYNTTNEEIAKNWRP